MRRDLASKNKKSCRTIPAALSFLWYLPESNWGNMDFQSVALPTELRYRPSQKRNESDSEIQYLIFIITLFDKNRLLWYILVVLSIIHSLTHSHVLLAPVPERYD